MVKTGKFQVSQGTLGGRLGTAIGQGLAEGLPKGIERGMLKQGLDQFAQQAQGLSPLEQVSKLFSIPGITPQMVQAIPEFS